MKKRELIDLIVERTDFGGESYGFFEDEKVFFKGGIEGQKVRVLIKKKRKNKIEGKILSVLEKSPLETKRTCEHFGICGGCSYLSVKYEEQLRQKAEQLRRLFSEYGHDEFSNIEVIGSPKMYGYKNKMEFTFGNETKDAPLSLGMHMKNRSNSVVTVDTCMIVDSDYRRIISETVKYFENKQLPFYKILSHEGFLRHLVVRKGHNTKEILVNIVTTSQVEFDFGEYVELLLSLDLDAEIVGILQTVNDSYSDAVIYDKLNVLFGRDFFFENLLGRKFKISPFSFFQTNTAGAEVLYEQVQKMLSKNKIVFDLYSGTGTIGIISAKNTKKVIGVEIVEEAVEMANENSQINGIENTEYLAGDVKEVVSGLREKPDVIILDPPRSGMHPKAIEDVISFGAKEIIYVSCNPKAFATELGKFKNAGYEVVESVAVDQFPNTPHVETVVLMSKVK